MQKCFLQLQPYWISFVIGTILPIVTKNETIMSWCIESTSLLKIRFPEEPSWRQDE